MSQQHLSCFWFSARPKCCKILFQNSKLVVSFLLCHPVVEAGQLARLGGTLQEEKEEEEERKMIFVQ